MRAARGLVAVVTLIAGIAANAAPAAGLTCSPAPLSGCRQVVAAKASKLLLKKKGGEHDKLVWKWKGEATSLADFGDPATSTTYALCIYDETAGVGQLKVSAVIPPTPAWTPKGKGLKYLDPALAAGGIKNILLKKGGNGKAKIVVKGHGANLNLPALPLAQGQHVVVQFNNTVAPGMCWEARFGAPAIKNDAGQFKDQGDGPIPPPPGTATATAISTATATATNTATPPGSTATATKTPVATSTATTTSTATATSTQTNTPVGGLPTATATATRTSTGTPTGTFTTTVTPTMGSSVCGNHFLEAGESCATCPADCTVLSCTAVAPLQTFRVNFAAPPGSVATVTSALVGYRSDRVSLPGSGASPGSRVKNRPPGTSQLVNDLNYALRVVIQANTGSIPDGRLFTVDFDSCSGQPAVTPADFGCQIESCGGSFGSISGCTCTVTTAP